MPWLRRLGSLKLSVVLLVLVFLAILGGTLAQAQWGSSLQTTFFARAVFVIDGWWLPGLPAFLAVLGLNLALGAWFHLERSWKHLGLWALHGTLVVLCWGSLGISAAQKELVVGLVPSASTSKAYLPDSPSGESRELPFTLTLDAFRIETYPNSTQPSDYVSSVRITGSGPDQSVEVKMNQPYRRAGWTVYQSSVQVVDGRAAPVFKLMYAPAAWFPYAITTLLALSVALIPIGRRPEAHRG